MARSRTDSLPLRRLLVLAGTVAVLGPLLTALVVGWVASLMAGLLVGLVVSLLLTLALLAAGWQLLDSRQPSLDGASPSPGNDLFAPAPPSSIGEGDRGDEVRTGAAEGVGASSVLLVEDDAVSRRIVGRLLQRLGVQADTVADGQAAIEAVRQCQYALVLMDCQLPILDGFAATTQIRAWEAERSGGGAPSLRLPIVALTASSPEDVEGRGRAAGMDDFLSKPLDLGRLATMLARWQVPHAWVRQSVEPAASATDSASRPSAAPVPLASTTTPVTSADRLPILDPAGLPFVDGRLPEAYQEIVDLFRQESARRMTMLTEAAARSDYPQVARIAHTLAGSASSIGAARLGTASAALETLAKGIEQTGKNPSAMDRVATGATAAHTSTLDETAIADAVEAVRRALHELDVVLVRLANGR